MISRYDNTLAEQQATTTEAALGVEPVSVYAKLPEALLTQYDDIDGEEFGCFAEGQMRDFADRTHALRMEQAAPKAASGEQNTVPAEWLEQAYREGWAACRDAETIGEEAEDWAFGNSTANSRMIDAQQPAPATQQAGDVVAYLDVGAGGYLDLGSELSEDALQQLPKGRHSLVIAGTYGIDGYVAAPQPAPAPLSRDQIREVFMANGFTVKEGQTDLKQYVYDAAYALLGTKPEPLSDDAKDAARWRLVETASSEVTLRLHNLRPDRRAQYIDAALAAHGENT